MSDIGDITARLVLDLGDTLAQLQNLNSALDNALAAPDTSKAAGALDAIGNQAQKVAQEVTDAFANVTIDMPAGTIVAGSAAADIAKEIAEAVGSTPITLSIDTAAAGSAAADIAQEVGDAIASNPITLDTSAAVDSLNSLIGIAEEDAQQINDALGGIQIGGIDVGSTPGLEEMLALAHEADAALQPLQSDLAGVDQAAADLVGPLDEAASAFERETSAITTGQPALNDLIQSFRDGEISVSEYSSAANALAAALEATGQAAAEVGQNFGGAAEQFSQFSLGAQDVINRQQEADQALAQGQSVLAELQAAYEEGAISANTLARAAQDLQSRFSEANPAIEESGSAANTAASSFETLVTALAGMVVLSQLASEIESFASSMAEATDAITRAQVALTAITGDAGQAQQTIEGLAEIAKSDGLSMPGLLTAAQRMQQLLPEGTDVTALLKQIADGAAVMGTNIDQAANMFDRLVNSSSLGARQLASLGLNLQGIADAMNAVNPALEATATNASALWKTLDPGDKLQILKAAFQDLAGTAEEMANKTFGGMWNSLVAQWDELMASAGQALIPLAQALKDFASNDIIPALQALVNGFKELPAPVQDAAIAAVALGAALIPLGAAAAGLALAVEALGPALAGLVMGTEAAEAAAAAGAGGFGLLGASLETIGAAALAAAPFIAAVGIAVAALNFSGAIQGAEDFASALSNNWGAIKTSIIDPIGDGIKNLASDFEFVAQSMASPYLQTARDMWASLLAMLPEFKPLLDDIATGASQAADSFSKWDLVIPGVTSLGKVLEDGATALNVWGATVQNTGDTTIPGFYQKIQLILDAFARLKDAANATDFSGFLDATQNVLTSQANLKSKLDDARTAVEQISQSIKDGTTNASGYQATNEDLAAAMVNLQHAQDAYNASIGVTKETLVPLTEATKAFVDTFSNLVTSSEAAQNSIDALGANVTRLQQSLGNAEQNLQAQLNTLDQVKAAYDNGAASVGDLEQAENRVAEASSRVAAAQKSLADAQQAVNTAFDTSGTYFAAENEFFSQLGGEALTAGDNLKQLGLDLQGIGADAAPQMSALNQAMADLASSATAAKVPTEQLITDIKNLAADTDTSWEDFDQNLQNFDATMQKVMKTDAVDAVNGLLAALGALANNNAPLSEFNQQLGTTDAAIKKLAGDDINAAIAAWDQMIAKMQQAGDSIGKVLQVQAEEAQAAITAAEQNGQAADQWIYKLEQVKLTQDSLKISADGMATAVVGGINDILKGFDQLGAAMADAIVNGKNMGDALIATFQKIAQSILTDLINGALAPLKKELIDEISNLLPALNLTNQVVGETAQMAASGMAAETAALNAVVGGEQAASAGATALTASSTAAAGALTAEAAAASLAAIQTNTLIAAIAAVIGAIAQIVGDVYLAAIDTKLFHVETSLVEIRNTLENLRNDQWSQFGQTYDRLGEILDRCNHMMDDLNLIAQQGPGGPSGGIGQQAQQDLDTISSNSHDILAALQSIESSLQTMTGNLGSIIGDLTAINGNLETWLPILDKDILQIVSALLYGGKTQSDSLQMLSEHVDMLGAGQAATGHEISGAINTQTGAVTQLNGQQLAAAQANYAAAQSTADQVAALTAEIAADKNLAADAIKAGDFTLAQSYENAAQETQRQLLQVESAVNNTSSMVNNVYDATQASSVSAVNNAGATITAINNGAAMISSAVASSSSAIASAVGAAIAGLTGTTIPYTPGRGNMGSGQPAPVAPYNPSDYLPPGTTVGGPVGAGPGPNPSPLGGTPAPNTSPTPNAPPANPPWPTSYGNGGLIINPPNTSQPIGGGPNDVGPQAMAPVSATGGTGDNGVLSTASPSGNAAPMATQAQIDKLTQQVSYDQTILSQEIAGGASKAIIDMVAKELQDDKNALAEALGQAPTTYTSSSGSTSVSGTVNTGTPPGGQAGTGPNSPDQIATAIANETAIIAGLKQQAVDLTNQITAAVANGDQASAAKLQTDLQTVNSSLSGANTILSEIQGTQTTTGTATVNSLAGVKASADQIAQAQKNAQDQVASLSNHLGDLNQQLIVAEAQGNTDLVNSIETQIGQTNSQLTSANGLLAQIDANVASGTDATKGVADDTKITSQTVKQASDYLNGLINGLQTHLSTLNTELINALSAGDMTLASTIEGEINQTNSQISTDTGLLKQIGGSAEAIAANTAAKGPVSNTPPSGVGPGSLIGNVAYSGMPLGYGYGTDQALPSFDIGGFVPHDMIAQLHGGEFVLTPDEVRASMNLGASSTYLAGGPVAAIAAGLSGGNQGDTITIQQLTVVSNNPTDMMRQLAAEGRRRSSKLRHPG